MKNHNIVPVLLSVSSAHSHCPRKQKTSAFFLQAKRFLKQYSLVILCVTILSTAAAVTFAYQNQIVGFERGYDEYASKHHGSVSSRGLAIIAQATAENYFVGFAIRYKNEQNQIVYDYFDRYPVFFSALFNRVLALRPKLSSKIYTAKQVMNLIFIATLLVAFFLSDKLIKNRPLALFAVLIAFSNPYLLFYKDMVHFDQPALFGFLLLTYAIALYKIDGFRFPVTAAAFIAIALGRGYASYAVLGVWLAMEAFLILRSRELDFKAKARGILSHLSFRLLVAAIVWGGLLLSYNIVVEAHTRNIPILQTSIIDSAVRRLSLDPGFNKENESIINWGEYARTEVNRIIKWAFPVKKLSLGDAGNALLLAAMLLTVGWVARRQPPEKRMVLLLLALSGFAWMIPMRNLAAFHDYTTMYFIGVPLAFFLSILSLLKPSRDAGVYLAIAALVVYVSAIYQLRDLHDSIAGEASEYTYDFMRIEEALPQTGSNIHLDGKIPYATNAEEFYLPDQYLAPLSLADYVITADRNYSHENLTPENSVMFLFPKR